MFNLTGKRFWYFLLSAVVIVPGLLSMVLFGFKVGLEFASGSTMTLVFSKPVEQAALRQELAGLGHDEAIIQGTRKEGYVLKASSLSPEKIEAARSALEKEFGSRSVFVFRSDEGVLKAVFSHKVEPAKLSQVLKAAGQDGFQSEPFTQEAFLVRTKTIVQEPVKDAQGNIVQPSEMERLEKDLKERYGSYGLFDFYSVSPIIASEIVRNAAIAALAACVGILLYIAWAFRKMPMPLRWGICAVIGIVHNVVVMLGIFSILGKVFNIEVDAMFITAVLTVVGYGVNDTVVVFDRIRENIKKGISRDFEVTVNYSLVETLGRSLITGLGAIFVMLALSLLGGITLRPFVLALLVGVIASTYASMFIASQLLVIWDKREWGRFVAWLPFARRAARG